MKTVPPILVIDTHLLRNSLSKCLQMLLNREYWTRMVLVVVRRVFRLTKLPEGEGELEDEWRSSWLILPLVARRDQGGQSEIFVAGRLSYFWNTEHSIYFGL